MDIDIQQNCVLSWGDCIIIAKFSSRADEQWTKENMDLGCFSTQLLELCCFSTQIVSSMGICAISHLSMHMYCFSIQSRGTF